MQNFPGFPKLFKQQSVLCHACVEGEEEEIRSLRSKKALSKNGQGLGKKKVFLKKKLALKL